MQINFTDDRGFVVSDKKTKVAFGFNVNNYEKDLDFVMQDHKRKVHVKNKKVLNLPGEFEISNVLIKALYTDDRKNTVFKTFFKDVTFVNLGDLKSSPDSDIFESLGENIDVLMINLSEDFTAKSIKDIVGKIDPRILLIRGEASLLPEAKEKFNADFLEENFLKISRAQFSSDRTETYIITAE